MEEKRKRRLPRRLDELNHTQVVVTAEEDLKRECYEVVDIVCSGIKDRFSQKGMLFYEAIESLVLNRPITSYKLAEVEESLCKYPEISYANLQEELNVMKQLRSDSFNSFSEFKSWFLGDSANIKLFPQVAQLCRLLLLLPATNASSERSFSALKLLKTCGRSNMTQARLNSMLLMHVHSEETDQLNVQEIIKEFVACHTTRAKKIWVEKV